MDESFQNDDSTQETDDIQDELTTTKAEDIEQALVNMENSSQVCCISFNKSV